MPIVEQRVVSSSRPRGRGPAAAGSSSQAPETPEPAPRSRKRVWVILLIVAVLLAAGASYYVLVLSAPEDDSPAEPVAGTVQTVDSMSINLADGHYLRLGLGMQLVEGHDTVDPAQARDAMISLFSGRTVAEVSDAEGRAALKAELTENLADLYDGGVMEVYFTDFVTQ